MIKEFLQSKAGKAARIAFVASVATQAVGWVTGLVLLGDKAMFGVIVASYFSALYALSAKK